MSCFFMIILRIFLSVSLLWFTWSMCGLDSFDSASFSVPLYGLWAVVVLGLVAWVVPFHHLHWHKLYGFLKQLPIPPQPWESISMDFIEQLPASEEHMAILVIVDCLTKQSLFIPTHDSINSPELAQLFLTHIFSKHGMPSHVTSDWGSEFISHFFQSLSKLLWMELHFMSGYNPEGDGQMECLNQVVEKYLQAYTNYQQDGWSSLLPLAEFAYNNATNEMTGVSPFFTNKGYHPSFVAELNEQVSSPEAQHFILDLDDLHTEYHKSRGALPEVHR